MNHLSERRKLLDDLLVKMEKMLEENIIVVADIQRKKYTSEMREKNEDSVSIA